MQIDGRWTVVASEPLNEKLKQNSVFVVQVIGWKEQCYLPLGNVIDIIPVGRSLDDGLRILNGEFKVEPTTCTSDEGFSLADEDGMHRKDIRDIITFTVDPKDAQHLDDAISVKEMKDHYELGIHIADVASFVIHGGELDENAKKLGATYHCSGSKNINMFPEELSIKHFSLLLNQLRNVVSLIFKINKKTDMIIGKPKFQLSKITSDKQLSYEDAEEIISKRYKKTPKFDTVEDCITVAYRFAKAQRKIRLVDWAYCQPDDQRLPGKRKANLMIEELSVLFNAKPDPEKIEEFKENTCAKLIPLSFHVHIQVAARTDDIDKMVDLIAADDIHPPLQPVIEAFRRCSSKAYVIRSNSSPKAEVGHYSLNVASYTQASSPIRRYMDIVLQRLLHSIICKRDAPYSQTEISMLCSQFERDIKNAKEYEQKAERISYAVSMTKQSALKLAFVVSIAPNKDHFAVSFPFNKKEQNPYSKQIKEFDKRIQVALDKKEELKRIQLALVEKNALQRSQLVEEIEELERQKLALEKIEELSEEEVKE
uniref:RNB domain-containing protein n=1 Tax=Mola mola TaxID=94237 RepID=A0A3Q3WTM0_MOLML